MTLSIKTINADVRKKLIKAKRTFIYAFWHGKQFLLIGWNKDKRLMIMTSLSRDGRLQDKILRRFGHCTVPGSSSRGAIRGLVGMIRGVKKGHNAAFPVDGPRGPLHKVKTGTIYLASKTGSAIIPLSSRAKCRHIFNKAWDKYELPKPFSSAVVVLGDPIEVPPNATEQVINEKVKELESVLNDLTAKADSYYET